MNINEYNKIKFLWNNILLYEEYNKINKINNIRVKFDEYRLKCMFNNDEPVNKQEFFLESLLIKTHRQIKFNNKEYLDKNKKLSFNKRFEKTYNILKNLDNKYLNILCEIDNKSRKEYECVKNKLLLLSENKKTEFILGKYKVNFKKFKYINDFNTNYTIKYLDILTDDEKLLALSVNPDNINEIYNISENEILYVLYVKPSIILKKENISYFSSLITDTNNLKVILNIIFNELNLEELKLAEEYLLPLLKKEENTNLKKQIDTKKQLMLLK